MDDPVEHDPQAASAEGVVAGAYDTSLEEYAEEDFLYQENAFQQYWRQNRLLNSMLISLLFMLLIFWVLWDIIIFAAQGGEQGSDFVDAGESTVTKPREKEKQVKLKQRQKSKAQPSVKNTFKTTAISDIVMPELNELDVKDISPVVSTTTPSTGDVGKVGVDLSALNNAFNSSFMGVQSQANRIAFIIDYSASMRGKDKVMRNELDEAVNKLPPAAEVCLIFFSGPSWLAGEDAKAIEKKWKGDNKTGWSPVAGFKPKSPKWIPVTPSTKKNLTKAIWNTPLTFGSVWDNSYRWALTKLNPKPDVIYFMTDGAASVKGMEIIKNNRGRTKIYTIAYGTPEKAKVPLQEIAAMTGGKFKFVSMDQIRNMENKIKK